MEAKLVHMARVRVCDMNNTCKFKAGLHRSCCARALQGFLSLCMHLRFRMEMHNMPLRS